jgi:hypothetical protein
MRPLFAAFCAAAAVAALFVGLACGGSPSPHSTSPATPSVKSGPGTPRCSEGIMGGCVSRPAGKLLAPAPRAGVTLVPDTSEFNGCAIYSEAIFRVYEAGTEREDSKALCHARELARLHTWAAVYTFLRANHSCVYQADRTVEIVRSLPVQVQVIVGDAETGIREGKVACFLHEIERKGYPAVEYTCPGCGDEQVGRIWIAAYPFRPAGKWVAHQFSSSSNCRGVFGDCSVNEGILSIQRVNRAALEGRRRALRRVLVSFGCRRRVAHREHLGPRCTRWFAEGQKVNRELA